MSVLILKVLMVLLVQPDRVIGFLLDGQCFASPPCTCSGHQVNCQNGNTGIMPTFKQSNITENYLHFFITGNGITKIPTNAFRNISLSNTTSLFLNLYDNKISTIDYGAFAGVEENVIELDLENNLLTSIPSAVASLTKLDYLQLFNNPIRSLASSVTVLANLGRHLTHLYLDLSQFSTWPIELSYLKKLSNLYLTNIKETQLDLHVFKGFENTLQRLSMKNTQLEKLPAAICHLHNIQVLTFTDNANLHGNSPIFEPCSQQIRSLTWLLLQNNNIRYFPARLFKTFPSLTYINLGKNQLTFIDSDLIPANLSLQTLRLDYNSFTRIPYAVKKFGSLQNLYLSNNKINTIEELDIDSLSFLSGLYLDYNPIEYISSNAFVNANQLSQLFLQNTKVRNIPSSLSKLPNLRYVSVNGSPIECSCDLTYLTSWDLASITISGYCEKTFVSIETYITVDLPQC